MKWFERIFTAAVIFGTLLFVASLMTGCADPHIAGVVNGKEVVMTAPPNVSRPYLRDELRQEDVVCPDEPIGAVNTQKQANQLVKDKIKWGRDCKKRSEATWTIIRNEP